MEQEFNFDQEDVQIVIVDDTNAEAEEADYSAFSEEDFASVDETEIDWSTL